MPDYRNRAWDTVLGVYVEWVSPGSPDPSFSSYPESSPSDHCVIEILSEFAEYRNRGYDIVLGTYVNWVTASPDLSFSFYPESNPSDHCVIEILESSIPANAVTANGVPVTADSVVVVATP